ncbi:MAG: hypothetical protein R2719_13540 [Micropruina sp.]|nr:hypothetical protein [Micropruina sp.]
MSTSVSERSTVVRTADPLSPIGGLQLADLPQLTFDYLQSVEVEVRRVTGNLVPGDEGTFTVRVTNGPIRLTGFTVHLFSSDATVAAIKAGAGVVIQYRLSGDRSTPVVEPDSTHAELYAFFLQGVDSEPNDVLEANEVFEQRFTYVAVGRGTAEFTAHLHGTVDRDSLFPRGNGADATAGVEIKRPRN